MRGLWWMSRAVLACGLLLSGCAEESVGVVAGSIEGTVTVVGDPLPVGNGELFLERDPDAPREDAVRRVSLAGGPQVYTFVLEDVPAGTYYLEACLSFPAGRGCAPYTVSPQGDPSPVRVRGGQSTQLQISF